MNVGTAGGRPALLERAVQLGALAELHAAGAGRIAVVGGPAGSGKTALLEAFTARAARDGARVLTATASYPGRGLPLGVVRQLFGGPRGRDLPVPVAWPGGATPPHVMHEVCAALLAAADRPLVVAVDDVHHADALSLECLLYFARRLRPAPVLLLLTEGVLTRRAHSRFHAELRRQPGFHGVRLPALSPSGVAGLLAAHLDLRSADRLAGFAHRVTGGSPLLVRALIEDHLALGWADPQGRTPRVGERFRQAVRDLLHRCDPAMREAARALAVLDGQGVDGMVGMLLERDAGFCARAVAALAATGLVEDGRFRHGRARDTVLDGLSSAERTGLHLRAARLLHEGGTPPAAVARHLVAADPGGEAGWALPVLQEAAERHLAVGELDAGLRCLRTAGRLPGDERHQAHLTVLLAQAEWRADPAAAVRHTAALSRAVREGRLPPALVTGAVNQLLWYGRVREAVDALTRLTWDCADEEDGAGLHAAWQWAAYLYPGAAGPRAGPVAEWRAMRSYGSDDITPALLALVHSSLLHGDRPSWPGPPPGRRADPVWQALEEAAHATESIRRGDLPGAEGHALAALERIPPQGWGVGIGGPLATLVLATTAMGRDDEALAHLGTAVPDAMFRSVFGLPYLYARGRHHLAAGRPQAALDDLRSCGRLLDRWGLNRPAFVPWRGVAAEAYLALGDVERARRLIAERPG